jgi:hypothetical protein
MRSAALGFRAHSGWTALVALSIRKGVPCVLARQRLHLVETFTYEFRQPYHTAEKMPLEEARAFISRVETEAERLVHRAINQLQENLRAQGYQLNRCGLVLASGRTLPPLPQILTSHALIHTADGELFRRAIRQASASSGLASAIAKERDLLIEISGILGLKPSDLTRRIADVGRPLGPPWSQDEKFASLVAWLALASPPSAFTRAANESGGSGPRPDPSKSPSKKKVTKDRRATNAAVTFDTVREIALSLDKVEESTSYGTPAFKVRGALFIRLHDEFDSTIVVRTDFDQREELLAADPETYYITDHYRNYPWVLVRLSRVHPDALRDLLRMAHRLAASSKRRSSRH